jgi:hypothetical protein
MRGGAPCGKVVAAISVISVLRRRPRETEQHQVIEVPGFQDWKTGGHGFLSDLVIAPRPLTPREAT